MTASIVKNQRLRVLTISDMYPRALQPQFAPFIEHQTHAVASYCDVVVLSPLRIFPPLSIFRTLPSVSKFREAWQDWQKDMDSTPPEEQYRGLKVYRPRYTAPPKHLFHGTWGLFAYPVLLPLLRRLHSEYQFDIIHAHNAAPNGLIAMLVQRWMKIPFVVSVHGFDLTNTIQQNPISRIAIETVYRKASAILANSRWTANTVIEHGAKPENVETVYYGANGDQPLYSPDVHTRDSGAPLQLLSVARLVEWKGIQWVLPALRQLLDEGLNLIYTVVGDGDYRDELEKLSQELGLTNHVRFLGTIPRASIWEQFASCDIFVLPSHLETFGIVYTEALSQGKPVIGCTTSGAADIHQLFPIGVELTEPYDVEGVVHALRRLIHDPERRKKVYQEAPRFIAERFTWDRMAQETFALYRDLINRPPLSVNSKAVQPF